MNMTKADYDELVRLHGLGANWLARDWDGDTNAFLAIPERTINNWWARSGYEFEKSNNNLFEGFTWYDEPLNIAAAIAEYERAKEGD